MSAPITPKVTANVIIELTDQVNRPIVLIERKYDPYGWAFPGGFVELGETIATAARREAYEETGLDVSLHLLLGIYSNPNRDVRGHTVGSFFIGSASGTPQAGDDAKDIKFYDPYKIRVPLAFDHKQILQDYCTYRDQGIIKLPE